MKITEIKIRNFRGFKEKTIRFNSNLTVVIGNNTAGKTTLLKAIQVGLGAYLQSLSRLPGGSQYRRNFSAMDVHKPFDPNLRDYVSQPEPARIDIQASFPITDDNESITDREISWYREFAGARHTTHTQACAGELMGITQLMEKRRFEDHQKTIFPLVLSFGAKRTEDLQTKTSIKVKERLSGIEKAYKNALHDKVDFEGTRYWLKSYDKSLRDAKEYEGTREAFFEALQTAIPALSEIDFDNGELEALVSVTGRNPERHHVSYMSDGLQSMINIVSEIAHRCIELNGMWKEDCIKETRGVVLIDEIDLYLHPHWQRHVLHDLTNAFPNIQFIVSTHSPYIIQSLNQPGQLVSFDDEADVSGEPFRESIEDISSQRMGMEQNIRSRKFIAMVEAAEQFFQAVDSGTANKEELKRQLAILEAEYSTDPAYLAMIKSKYPNNQ